MLVWFAAATNHCSFFPGAVIESLKDELKDFSTSKGTIRFQPDHPLPAALRAGAEAVHPAERVTEGVTVAQVRAPGGGVIGFSGP